MGIKKYYELHCKCYMRQDVKYENTQELICNLVNCAMISDEYLKGIHLAKDLKGYSVSGLYTAPRDGIYKVGEMYEFMARSYDKKLIKKLEKELMSQSNSYIVVLMTYTKEWEHRVITELYTYTPCVITLKEDERLDERKKYWTKEYNIDILTQKIENNLAKKYKELYGYEITDFCMINEVEVRNNIYKVAKYKGLKIIGNQIRIKVNMDNKSQELANLAIVQGLGEKNSCLASGFVKGVYIGGE